MLGGEEGEARVPVRRNVENLAVVDAGTDPERFVGTSAVHRSAFA